MSRRRTLLWKWAAMGLLLLGMLYAVLLLLSSRSLRDAYADLEADERPMKQEDLIPPQIPEQENAATFFQAAILVLKAESHEEENLFARLHELSDDLARPISAEERSNTLGELQILLRKDAAKEALYILQEGVNRPGCRYDLDYSKGTEMLLPHLSNLRALSRILTGVSRVQATREDFVSAWQTVILGLRLADALKREPILISQLIRIQQFDMVCGTIHELCELSRPSPTDIPLLMDLLSAFEDPGPLVLSMDGERLFMGEWAFTLPLPELRRLARQELASDITLSAYYKPLLRTDHAAYLRALHEMVRIMEEPFSSEDAAEKRVLSLIPSHCFISRLLVPALTRSKTTFTRAQAKSRITRLGLAALEFHRNQGRFPMSLGELEMEPILDPFTQKQILYRVEPEGFLLYSCGPNQKDDGGIARSKPSEEEMDILWKYRFIIPQDPSFLPRS